MELKGQFEIKGGGYYSLSVTDTDVTMQGYTFDSLIGGTGTECAHTVGVATRAVFLKAMGVASGTELYGLLETFGMSEWVILHQQVSKYQTDKFVWFESGD
jgi:hypothetical protein